MKAIGLHKYGGSDKRMSGGKVRHGGIFASALGSPANAKLHLTVNIVAGVVPNGRVG